MATSSQPQEKTMWRVVYEKCGGKLYIHHLELRQSDNGRVVFQKLRNAYRQGRTTVPYNIWDRASLFWKPVVEIATLSANSTCDLEKQHNTKQVFITHRQKDRELTAAFKTPQLLAHISNFVKDNARFESNKLGTSMERCVLLIGLRMNRIGLLALIVLNIFLCLGSGLMVGYFTHDVNLGVAVTSGVAAVLGCVQAVLVLLFK